MTFEKLYSLFHRCLSICDDLISFETTYRVLLFYLEFSHKNLNLSDVDYDCIKYRIDALYRSIRPVLFDQFVKDIQKEAP